MPRKNNGPIDVLFSQSLWLKCALLCLPGAIPYQRSKTKGQHQRVDFFDEMWKIIRQMDDFGRFLKNFCSFWVFLAKNLNTQKWLFWKRENLKLIFFFRYWTTYFKYHIHHSYGRPFITVLVIFTFFNVVKNEFL